MDRGVLFELFSSGDWESRFESCLQEGLDINQRSVDDGWTLVHFAIEAENFNAVEWLHSRGADINARDESGNTAFHYAVEADIEPVIETGMRLEFRGSRLLMSLGADPDIRNNEGDSPVDIVARYGEEVSSAFGNVLASDS